MQEQVKIAPDLKTLIRQTGIVPAAGAGCALTLVAFAAPVSLAAWLWGWSWWLLPATLAGLLLAGLVALLAVRRIAHRTLVRLAADGAPPEGEDDAPAAPADSHALAEAVLRAAWLPGIGPSRNEVFDSIAAEDPGVGARATALVHDRAVDDLVNGDGPDPVRLTRFVALVDVVTEGARRLGDTPAGEPWRALAATLKETMDELDAALAEASRESGDGDRSLPSH